MKDLSRSIIEAIKKEKIIPVPKWHFLLKNYVIWSLFFISAILGGIAFSIILLQLSDIDWDIARRVHPNTGEWLIAITPYFWIIILILFVGIAYHNFRHTEKGYKSGTFLILGTSVLVSLIAGSIVFATGISRHIETFGNNIPRFREMHSPRMRLWMQENKGLMAGVVKEIFQEEILLRSLQDKIWNVDIRDAKLIDIPVLEVNQKIGVLGERIDNMHFKANEIRPWQKPMMRNPILENIVKETD
jgi:hypothetical protein